jgi:hypothetical protein
VFLRAQHIKGLGGLPIFSNITLNNGQCKVMVGRIVEMSILNVFNGHPMTSPTVVPSIFQSWRFTVGA